MKTKIRKERKMLLFLVPPREKIVMKTNQINDDLMLLITRFEAFPSLTMMLLADQVTRERVTWNRKFNAHTLTKKSRDRQIDREREREREK